MKFVQHSRITFHNYIIISYHIKEFFANNNEEIMEADLIEAPNPNQTTWRLKNAELQNQGGGLTGPDQFASAKVWFRPGRSWGNRLRSLEAIGGSGLSDGSGFRGEKSH